VALAVRLWLVRHGATDWSDAGRLNGWTDVPLTDGGRRQATALRERLARHRFAGVWSSDLARATDTARLAVGNHVADRRLRELDFGSLEGKTWGECPREVRDGLIAFHGFSAPGGESVPQLRSRVLEFIETLEEGDHVLFTHGGVVRLLLLEQGRNAPIGPGGVQIVRRRRRRAGDSGATPTSAR
jgi:2,3-bisphosphoglycerate-dependent phosphoglycerate mutase